VVLLTCVGSPAPTHRPRRLKPPAHQPEPLPPTAA
jgi:hypothetical protein